MRAETVQEQLFFMTTYLEGEDASGGTWTGTGFVVGFETTEGLVPFVVTNKHVLAGATKLTVRFVARGADGQPEQRATQIQMVQFGPHSWAGHPDAAVDVAVFQAAPVLNQMETDGHPALVKWAPASMLLTSAQAEETDALEAVTFIGYPNGLFDTTSYLPIARRGQTATPLSNDYRGYPAFLIDASVFPGSSGSPVLLVDRGGHVDRQGNFNLGSNRIHLLGVLAAVHTRQVDGRVVDLPTKQVAVFDDPIDLGIVYKASAIQETVDIVLAAIGIALADPAPDLA
ncbi:trypsin-like peptidase domain-containing protein [Aeromicrobium sp. CFBP 8757]|uniref:S1 family peptidase n=1 Tax=Aeromicrobium sp. CFBP 8757 TaxID=2775288 RepID=UPI00178558AA|nr:serine protease [Aeromicrobium sp. CFBP 8757]MBD8608646.1 trypsin-like peptidase domain-containing protein [Aeromicrobium sp. CFBP 8757]